ncbi:helix-turn-helix domain-containing protein [Flavobacterium oreochromis]|uniref:helix-turn-helix domain-containing protein n=1 Tax=Flavobacterium oreochromis TaxID=2906078 RepID=UPI00385CAD8F
MNRNKSIIKYKFTEKDKEVLSELDTKGLNMLQKKVLCIYEKKMCNVRQTCRSAGISRQTFYNWLDTLDTFKKAVDDVREGLFDDVESILHQKIFVDKDTTSLIWFTKTKMKSRGYVEQNNIQNNVEATVENKYANWTEEEIDAEIARLEEKIKP